MNENKRYIIINCIINKQKRFHNFLVDVTEFTSDEGVGPLLVDIAECARKKVVKTLGCSDEDISFASNNVADSLLYYGETLTII